MKKPDLETIISRFDKWWEKEAPAELKNDLTKRICSIAWIGGAIAVCAELGVNECSKMPES